MIFIPMLGKSSRFFNAGFADPKYKLICKDKTIFELVILSFEKYFKTDTFVFAVRSDFNDFDFVQETLARLGVEKFKIFVSNNDTRGQAETVYNFLDFDLSEELFIFNIDTILYRFEKKSFSGSSGYLEVFEGEGDHWSFVLPSAQVGVASRVVEKTRISNLCSNGLYYFSSISIYKNAFEGFLSKCWDGESELYIAPLYDYLISIGCIINFKKVSIDDMGFCGTPDEYIELCSDVCER